MQNFPISGDGLIPVLSPSKFIRSPVHGPLYDKWCVPSAISALTGHTTDQVSLTTMEYRRTASGKSSVSKRRGKKCMSYHPDGRMTERMMVGGMYHDELVHFLKKAGVPYVDRHAGEFANTKSRRGRLTRPTLAKVMQIAEATGKKYLVASASHAIAIQGRLAVDSNSKGVLSNRAKSWKRRSRVYWLVEINDV